MDIRKILVIKLRHLGDVLLSSPVYSVLRRAFPDGVIDAYVWKEAAPLLQGHPAIAKIYTYDREWKGLPFASKVVREIGLLRRLRAARYDLVINLTEGDRGAHVALISGAHTRVGFEPKKRHIARAFTHLVHPCKVARHAVERDLDALRVLGISPRMDERELVFSISEEDLAESLALVPKGPFAVIHATARWKFKCPPPSLMAKVADRLGMAVVLTGARSEIAYVEQVEQCTQCPVINAAGKTSLKGLGALLKRSKGLITVDSVALHMASALKIPTVALFGPTSEANWGPWRHPRAAIVGQKWVCRPCLMAGCGGSKMSDCLYALSPDAIVDAFTGVTSGRPVSKASSLLTLNSLEM